MFLARKVFLKTRLVLRYSLEQIMSTITVMTFSRHTAFLPAFREELEFDFAVDTLDHSDKSDCELNSSCSDDRLSSSYSETKLSSSLIASPRAGGFFSKSPLFKMWNKSTRAFHVIPLRKCSRRHYHNVCTRFPFNFT